MGLRRRFVRIRRWLRRPGMLGLAAASLVVHLSLMALLGWLEDATWVPPPPPPDVPPLIVELPAAEPGRPLVKPETPAPSPPAVAARPAPAPRPSPPAARPATPPAPSQAPP